jgi:hypothetical protein
MPRGRTGDYSRVEEALEEIKEDIEFEYGKPYGDLTHREQRQVLLDHFFKGLPQYRGSAEEMREGLGYAERTGEPKIRVDVLKIKGKEHRIIRDSKTGRFRQWIKE